MQKNVVSYILGYCTLRKRENNEKPSVTGGLYMDYALLDELVAIQKKTEASKSTKSQYAAEMAKLFATEGLSDHAVYYLKAGAAFSGALPFVEYIKQLPLDEECRRRYSGVQRGRAAHPAALEQTT